MRSTITVVTPSTTQDLTTVDTVKLELGVTDTASDDLILTLIHQASNIIAVHCNRIFGLEEVVETYWPERLYWSERTDTFLLKRTPVDAISNVTLDGTVLPPSEYRVDNDSGLLYRLDGSSWPWCWWSFSRQVVIEYSGGYNLLGTLPYALERAAISLVKQYWSSVERDPALRAIDVPGLGRQEFWVGANPGGQSGQLSPEVEGYIVAFKRPAVA
jgi:hypothetical protein